VPGGSISGTVTGTGGTPLADVQVTLYESIKPDFAFRGTAQSDADGIFHFESVPAGSYSLGFSSPGFVSEWLGDTRDSLSARVFTVSPGDTIVGLDARLALSASISGMVTDEGGLPIPHANTVLCEPGVGPVPSCYYWKDADGNGVFRFTDIRAGRYTIFFGRGTEPLYRDYASEYWNDRAQPWQAEYFTVAEGQTLTGMDAALEKGGSMSGRVVGTGGAPLADVRIDARANPRSIDGTFVEDTGSSVRTDSSGRFEFRGMPANAYHLEFWAPEGSPYRNEWWSNESDMSASDVVVLGERAVVTGLNAELDLPGAPWDEVVQIAGDDRYATSAMVSASQFARGVPVAYIASGLNFPDALSGAPLAGITGGPVLLTEPDALPDVVADELRRLQPSHVVILGGTAVISTAVESAIDAIVSGSPTRLAGDDRYATSAAISASHFQPGVPVAYVASGLNFPDALSGAPLAGLTDGPVLLTAPDGVPDVVADELRRLAPSRIVILGGTSVIGDSVEARLDALISGAPTRLAGDDRFATSVEISASQYEPGVPVVYIANGFNFPDALAGAPLAGLTGGPVLLTTYDGLPDVVERELVRLKPHRVVILGGRSVVNGVVYNRLIQLESAPDWDLGKLD